MLKCFAHHFDLFEIFLVKFQRGKGALVHNSLVVQSPALCHSTSFLVLKGMIYVARVNPEVFLKIQASLNRFNTENLNSREGEPRA